jgi:ABC-type Fe3+-siderophore transport system permease subunit
MTSWKRFRSALIPVVLLVILFVLAIRIGAVKVPISEIWTVLIGGESKFTFIIKEYRLPRAVVAMLAGAGLAVSGVILQALIRNSLASPDVIGITKGAGFAAALVLFVFPKSPVYVLPAAAVAGALLAFGILVALSRRMTLPPATFALVGIAVSAVFQAGIQYLLVKNPSNINVALLWMAGSLFGRDWDEALMLLPWIAVLVPLIWWQSLKLDVFRLGDHWSVALGLRVRRERFLLLLFAVCLAGFSVAAVGAISFIGLLAPHIARLLVGGRHHLLTPVAAVLGADLMLLGDVVGRIVIIPREVPVGIATAVLGAPYFLYLLRRERMKMEG